MTGGVVMAAALGGVGLIVTVLILTVRAGRREVASSRSGANEQVLTEFVVRSLELHGFADVLADAAATAQTAFGASRAVIFEPGAKEGAWDVWAPGPQPLEPVPDAARPVFAWFKHNAEVIVLDEVGGPRFGAMRIPLEDLKNRYQIDTLVPLVDRRQTIAALGLALGRKPAAFERGLLDHLRIEATTAAANVRLHREAAHKLTLEKEVDLASAVQRQLVPAVNEGEARGFTFAGHVKASGQAGSDFWSTYEVAGGKLLVVVGDVIGGGLGGSMASAVTKSCADALVAAGVQDPGTLLTALNRALWRPVKPIQVTCVAALFDPGANRVSWANAGHLMPYVADREGKLGVLAGNGPILGDVGDAQFTSWHRDLASGDQVVLYTDGLVEALNAQRVPFGERRLQKAIVAAAKAGAPAAVREQVLSSLASFTGGVANDDDELLVAVRRT
jgi:serine phosphatase RsbU (regulator of sigma subunit)